MPKRAPKSVDIGSKTQKRVLKPTILCKIIAMCAKNGVAHIKYGDLELHFENGEESGHFKPKVPRYSKAEKKIPLKEIKEQEEMEEVALVQATTEIREMEIENLQLTDPQAWEELMGQGELKDGDNNQGGLETVEHN